MRPEACLSGMRQGAMFSPKARFRYAEARNGAYYPAKQNKHRRPLSAFTKK